MRLRYPGRLPNVSYELQLAPEQAIQHEPYFGKGNKVVLALYYAKSVLKDTWLQAIKPYKPQIEDQLGEDLVLGFWGEHKDWVILEKQLDFE